MTPQEALDLLDQATSQVSGNRAVHHQISIAIEIIRQTITPPAPEQVEQPDKS